MWKLRTKMLTKEAILCVMTISTPACKVLFILTYILRFGNYTEINDDIQENLNMDWKSNNYYSVIVGHILAGYSLVEQRQIILVNGCESTIENLVWMLTMSGLEANLCKLASPMRIISIKE